MNQNFMKEKPILPLVISMSLPMVISMAINSLYNIVDSYFVAKISEDAMTAISLVYPLQNLMTAIAVGFGIAMNARIAFCLGAKDQEKADEAAVTGMFLSMIHGVILMVACMAGMPRWPSASAICICWAAWRSTNTIIWTQSQPELWNLRKLYNQIEAQRKRVRFGEEARRSE